MCDSLERHSKDGTLENTWKKRFSNKWPTMTTLMHQSEITIQPYFEHEYADPHDIVAYQNNKIPEWDGTSETSWSAARSIDDDLHNEDIYSKVNKSPKNTKQRRCDKVCRNVLCVFLILSIVMAVAAAIGLSFFLNLNRNNGLTDHGGHFHGNHIPANISTEEEIYLTKILCGVVKHLLIKTDFPVDRGIESCHTTLLFLENSESLHIEMNVSPKEGYTIKEKILRILSDGVLAESSKGLKNKEFQASTSVNGLLNKESTMPDINLIGHITSTTTTSSSSPVVSQDNIVDSTQVPEREHARQTTSNVANQHNNANGTSASYRQLASQTQTTNYVAETSTDAYESAAAIEVIKDHNIADQWKGVIVDEPILPTTFDKGTTLPPIIMPVETNTETYQYETSTSKEKATTSINDFNAIHETSTTSVEPFVDNNLDIQDSFSGYKNNTSTEVPKIQIPLVIDTAPVVTKLFNPNLMNPFVDGSTNVDLSNVRQHARPNKSPKIVESLMAGGVMKLPFKTNSNFRFLFSSDSKGKSTKRDHLKVQEVAVIERTDNMINTADVADMNNNARFNSQDIKYSRTDALNLFTDKPKTPKLLRTIRKPISSTKSFMQRKIDLQRKPKRAIDVTEFGAQSVVLKT